jgi:hypothetical protein
MTSYAEALELVKDYDTDTTPIGDITIEEINDGYRLTTKIQKSKL